MNLGETNYRVCYADTDQMGVVYYGNYAKLFEIGRTEAMRKLGIVYKKLEDTGIVMPVVEMTVKYHQPALYDDFLTIKTSLFELPGMRMTFQHEIYNEAGAKLVSGQVQLCFLDSQSKRLTKVPADMLKQIRTIVENSENH